MLSLDEVIFQSRLERSKDRVVLHLTGDLIEASRPTMLQALDDALAVGSRLVVIDLRELRFIDSIGVGCLIESRKRAGAHGGVRIALLADCGSPRRMLAVTGLDGLFEVVGDLTELTVEPAAEGRVKAVLPEDG